MAYIGNKPANKAVVASDLDPAVITGQTALATSPADTDEFLISDAGTLKRLDASLIGGGKIGQVVSVAKTDTFSSASSSFTDLTGITVNITPSATSSKVLILCSLSLSVTNGGGPQLKLVRGSTDIGIADAASNRARMTTSYVISAVDVIAAVPMIFLDSPSTTSQTTYKVQGFGYNTNTIYVNRTSDDADEVYRQRGISTITVMEILA